MANAELEVITSVCEKKDIAVVMQGSNIDDMFTAYKDVWNFVKDHYGQYRAVPDIEVVKKRFDEIDSVDTPSPTAYYMDRLRERHLSGQMNELMLRAAEAMTKKGAQFTYEKLITELAKLGRFTSTVKDVDLTDVDEAIRTFNEVRERSAEMGGTPGIPTGFKSLDLSYKTGAAPGHLIMLMGYTGRMKSFFSALWAVNAWRLGYKPMVISLEMNPDEYRNRVYSMMNPGKFSINDMMTGDVNTDDMREWANKAFADRPGFIVPSMSGVLETTPNVVQAKIDTHKPDLVVLDYIQLMKDNGKNEGMTPRMLNLTNELKALAQANNIPIIAISAVTDDEGDKRDAPPELRQMAWSRAIEYNANLAVAVHKHDQAGEGDAFIEIAGRKNRSGPLFNFGLRANVDKGIYEEVFDF